MLKLRRSSYPLRVRALVMTIGLDLPKQILNAQTEVRGKPENLKNEDVGVNSGKDMESQGHLSALPIFIKFSSIIYDHDLGSHKFLNVTPERLWVLALGLDHGHSIPETGRKKRRGTINSRDYVKCLLRDRLWKELGRPFVLS
ncbi:hypothetical protein Tco_1245991 [Tanacetum coccineum]